MSRCALKLSLSLSKRTVNRNASSLPDTPLRYLRENRQEQPHKVIDDSAYKNYNNNIVNSQTRRERERERERDR